MIAPIIELIEMPLSIPIPEIGPPLDRRRVWCGIQVNEREESI
jgi:hypothetical protein